MTGRAGRWLHGGPNSRPLAGAKSGTLASARLKLLLLPSRCLELGTLAAGRRGHVAQEPDRLGASAPLHPTASSRAWARGSVGWTVGLGGHPTQLAAGRVLNHCCHLLGPAGKAG